MAQFLRKHGLFLILSVFFFAFYIASSVRKYTNYQLQNFDFGIQFQTLDLLARMRPLYSSTRGLHIWADNQDYVQFFWSFLSQLDSPQQLILIFFACSIAASGILCYSLFPHRKMTGIGVALFTWLSPFMINMNMDAIHPEALATSLLLAVYIASRRGIIWLFWLALTLTLTNKEDIAITSFALLAVFYIAHQDFQLDRRHFAFAGILCVVVFFFNQKLMLPIAKDWTSLWYCGQNLDPSKLLGHASPWFGNLKEKLQTLDGLGQIFSRDAFTYIVKLLWPLAMIPLNKWSWFIPVLPAVAINMIGGKYLIEGQYHYDHSTMGALLIGLCHTLSRITLSQIRCLIIVGIALLNHLSDHVRFHNPQTRIQDAIWKHFWSFEKSQPVVILEKINALLPKDIGISSDHVSINYLLAKRDRVFMFENPFKPAYFGLYGSCDGSAMPFTFNRYVDVAILNSQVANDALQKNPLPNDFFAYEHQKERFAPLLIYINRTSKYAESIQNELSHL